MSSILPRGFVVNSPEVGGLIKRIKAEPLDLVEIARLWRVYNTTRRRLLDPTAERLENYWWRIWRSQLKGATVAKLFLDISNGDSFAPLRSSANRDEGTRSENIFTHSGPEVAGTVTVQPHFKSRPSTKSSSTLSKVQVSAMPHSILKNSRGPSTTGPRPNAHFILPHDSEPKTSTNSSIRVQSHTFKNRRSPKSAETLQSVLEAVALGEPGPDGLNEVELQQESLEEANRFANRHETSQKISNGDPLVLQKSIPLSTEGLQEERQHLSDSTFSALPQGTSTKDEVQWK